MADQPSPRRRFQFRLRTLMILVALMAVPCAYVGWQAKIVRERRALLDQIEAAGGGDETAVFYNSASPPPPPWLRRILGDETIELLLVPSTTDEETMARIHLLFPDTQILVGKKSAKGIIVDSTSLKRD
jgi:hypothetical protein